MKVHVQSDLIDGIVIADPAFLRRCVLESYRLRLLKPERIE